MSGLITIEEHVAIGANRHGYRFGVGRVGDRWVGGARCPGDAGSPPCLFLFPQVAEGSRLGLTDRDTAIRLTGAVALDPEGGFGFGGIDVWYVGPELRGDPDAYRCPACGAIHLGECEPDDFDPDFDDFDLDDGDDDE